MNSHSRIDGVTFDVGGTLIMPWPSVGHIYAEVAAKHGFKDIPADLLNRRFEAAWRLHDGFDFTRADWEEVVNRTFHGLVPTPTPFFRELYERFDMADAWRVLDDVRPALKMLAARGLRLAVISNWDERLRPLLERLGLAGSFATLIISCEVRCCKPSRTIFDHAARALSLAPGSILHVGDSFELDVRGARAAGFEALHLRRDRQASGPGEVHSLTDLAAKIAVAD